MFKDTVRINKNSHKSKNINYILKIFAGSTLAYYCQSILLLLTKLNANNFIKSIFVIYIAGPN